MSDYAQDIVVVEQPSVQLAPLADPQAFVAGYTAMADALNEIIKAKNLSVKIGQGNHVRVEGWTLLGSMLGVFPICVWTKQLLDADDKPFGWEARCEARTRDGNIVGAAEAQCTRDENQWSFTPTGKNGNKLPPRDDFALRSMAQTRATSKALRQPLGFVVSLAGYDATPAEEMPVIEHRPAPRTDPAEDATPDGDFISDAQRRRLFAIASENGVDEERLRELVEHVTGQRSTGAIPRDRYERLCAEVEAEGLPFG